MSAEIPSSFDSPVEHKIQPFTPPESGKGIKTPRQNTQVRRQMEEKKRKKERAAADQNLLKLLELEPKTGKEKEKSDPVKNILADAHKFSLDFDRRQQEEFRNRFSALCNSSSPTDRVKAASCIPLNNPSWFNELYVNLFSDVDPRVLAAICKNMFVIWRFPRELEKLCFDASPLVRLAAIPMALIYVRNYDIRKELIKSYLTDPNPEVCTKMAQ